MNPEMKLNCFPVHIFVSDKANICSRSPVLLAIFGQQGKEQRRLQGIFLEPLFFTGLLSGRGNERARLDPLRVREVRVGT